MRSRTSSRPGTSDWPTFPAPAHPGSIATDCAWCAPPRPASTSSRPGNVEPHFAGGVAAAGQVLEAGVTSVVAYNGLWRWA